MSRKLAGRQAWRNVLVPRSTVPVSPNEAIHGPKWPILGLITFAYYATILNRRPFLARASAQSRRIQRSHSSLPVSTVSRRCRRMLSSFVTFAAPLRFQFSVFSFRLEWSLFLEMCNRAFRPRIASLFVSFLFQNEKHSNRIHYETVNRQLETKYVEAASASILNLFFVLNLSCNNLSNLDFCLILSIYLIKKRANYYNNWAWRKFFFIDQAIVWLSKTKRKIDRWRAKRGGEFERKRHRDGETGREREIERKRKGR